MQQQDIFYSIAQSLPKISSYLSLPDKISLHNSSSMLRQLTSNSSYWPTLQLSSSSIKSQNMLAYVRWFFKAMRQFKPYKIIIFIYEVNESILEVLVNSMMQGAVDSVIAVDLYCQSDDFHLACSLCFPSLEELTIRSKCATNELVQFMSENLLNLNSLIVIKNDIQFTCLNLAKYMSNPMKKLVMKPYLVQFCQVQLITQKSSNSMLQLELDVEQCSEKQIIKILHPLRQLQKLRLYHLQNLETDQALTELLGEQTKIQELSLTKTSNFQLSRILNAVSSKNLLCLDISESRYVNDFDIKRLAEKCPNLREVNVSWCNGLTSEGLKMLVSLCLNIEVLNITGVKQSRDQIFQQYLQLLPIFDDEKYTKTKNQASHKVNLIQKDELYKDDYFFKEDPRRSSIRTLRKLKILECNSCNVISDNMLKIIYVINRAARTYNYYGNYMGLFPTQNQETFC